MTSPASADPAAAAERYVATYNSGDLDAIGALLDADVHIVHHNRGIEIKGKDAAIELFGNYGAAFPDKKYSNRRDLAVSGDTAIIQHSWGGTAVVDVPGWADAGGTVSLDLATFITFRDGLVLEYHDYG